MNYFELFNIEPTYEINVDDLQSAYLVLQKKYHPDNCETIDEQLQAVEKTIEINDAYDVLKDEVLLLKYYAKTMLDLDMNDKEIQADMGPEDLMFLLELQEAVMENPAKINEYKQELKEKTLSIALRLKESIKAEDKQEIKSNLAKLVFFNKSLKHI